jgi:hypothetical protein
VSATPKLLEALNQVLNEAAAANEVIRLNRDGQGSGRVKVATALHRIEHIARAAIAQAFNSGEPA